MTPDPTIAALAEKLTAAERHAMLRAEEDGHLGNRFIRRWTCNGRTLRAIKSRGLGTTVWSGLVLTPLGLAVAHHLRTETQDKGSE